MGEAIEEWIEKFTGTNRTSKTQRSHGVLYHNESRYPANNLRLNSLFTRISPRARGPDPGGDEKRVDK